MASTPHAHMPSELTYTPPPTASPTQTPTGSANISIREYIYFLPHPLPNNTPVPYTPGLPSTNPLNLPSHPFEPTSTLVLTTPGRTFVDIRYLKPLTPDESPLPNHGETERLEWAFAGSTWCSPPSSSSSASPSSPHSLSARHTSWTHWLDSRVAPNQPVPAHEATTYHLGSGVFLEHGHAWHPRLARVAGHEELWRHVAPLSTNAQGTKVCVLLRCEDEAGGVRGVVVRVGRVCQSVLVWGGGVTTERWDWDGDGDEMRGGREEVGWKRVARTGDAFLPCAVAFRTEVVRVGGRVGYGGFEWIVEEAWEWK